VTAKDQWSKWLLETRFGGDEQAAARGMAQLLPIRDRVLKNAALKPGETVLDVGCGDGLIAFGALDGVGATGRVIFSDVSAPLLEHCRRIADNAGVTDRCEFLQAQACDLSALADTGVDVVTTRSVLIYVKDKASAFKEFFRVLRRGGRASLFEPINRFDETYGPGQWWGAGVEHIEDLAGRLLAHYRLLQPLDSDPMMDFDQHDLLRFAEDAGFKNVHLNYHVVVIQAPPLGWDAMINSPGNPNIPSIAEAIHQIFTAEERERFEKHLRPRVEAGGSVRRNAVAYLTARKVA
jgi:ubiquinone/menaquinone biosynthesis C-methylase UbiE